MDGIHVGIAIDTILQNSNLFGYFIVISGHVIFIRHWTLRRLVLTGIERKPPRPGIRQAHERMMIQDILG